VHDLQNPRRITKTVMKNLLEHFSETHNLEMSDQITILDRNDDFSPKKMMENLNRNNTELDFYSFQ